MGESLKSYALRSSGQEIHDCSVLTALLPDSDVLLTLSSFLLVPGSRGFSTFFRR
jgi:hypothetical protein